MKKIIALMFLATVFISGCTTWHGISQTDKPGTYYMTTNRYFWPIFPFPFIRSKVLKCTSDETGNLTCKEVDVDER